MEFSNWFVESKACCCNTASIAVPRTLSALFQRLTAILMSYRKCWCTRNPLSL